MSTPEWGQIITFYSYKGGTGRTMALANAACLLARRLAAASSPMDPLSKVLAIDWDFEAPGLHRYFSPYLAPSTPLISENAPGCLDLFMRLDQARNQYDKNDFVSNRRRAREALDLLEFERYLLPTNIPGLQLMKAGRFDADYAERVSRFAWEALFMATPGLFAGFTDFVRDRFRYVLVDSRTGVTDTSGICSMILPDTLVVVFTPNEQSLTGLAELVRKATAYRKNYPDGRPLAVFPLPSRIDTERPLLLEQWRGQHEASGRREASVRSRETAGYQCVFEQMFREIYDLDECDLTEYFNEVYVQHVPDYAYGEPIAVELETRDSRTSLRRSYEAFVDRLVELEAPWQSLDAARRDAYVMRECSTAIEYARSGETGKASDVCKALLVRVRRSVGGDRLAETIMAIGRIAYGAIETRPIAGELFRAAAQAFSGSDEASGPVDPDWFAGAANLALQSGDSGVAIELCVRSLEIVRREFGEDHPASVNAMGRLARALHSGGRLDEARRLEERVLEARTRLMGEEHRDTLISAINLADTLKAQGELTRARALEEKTLEVQTRLFGTDDPDALDSLRRLAQTLSAQGDLVGASELELEMRTRRGGREDAATLVAISNLARAVQAQGDYERAHALEEEALETRGRVLGWEHPDTLASMSGLAETLRAKSDLTAARALGKRVLEARERLLGEAHPDTLTSMEQLAQTLYAQDQKEEARGLERRAATLRRPALREEEEERLRPGEVSRQPQYVDSMPVGSSTLEEMRVWRSRSLCFVLMPFGRKPGPAGALIDFDAVYSELIGPAVTEAGLEALRADEEMTAGIIQKPMFERLILCEYAVVDLTTANPNVFYELGLRHAVRSWSTLLLFAQGSAQLPFDVALLRALPYRLGTDGRPSEPEVTRRAIAQRLESAKEAATDSPVFQLVEGFPDIQRLKTDVFRDRVEYSRRMRDKLAGARRTGAEAVRQVERELGDVANTESAVVIDLYLSYRAVRAWNDMIALHARMARPLAATVLVREQLGLALNRAGRGEEAEKVLVELIEERGPSSETHGILGRVYKDRWEAALKAGQAALARGLLAKAIETYLKGFDSDWRDAYPGVNAVTLMELKDPPDPRRTGLIPVVRYAVERRIAAGKPDYWDHATRIELAVLAGDQREAEAALADALAVVREKWEPETTARNLRLIREARERRGEAVAWAEEIEQQLASGN